MGWRELATKGLFKYNSNLVPYVGSLVLRHNLAPSKFGHVQRTPLNVLSCTSQLRYYFQVVRHLQQGSGVLGVQETEQQTSAPHPHSTRFIGSIVTCIRAPLYHRMHPAAPTKVRSATYESDILAPLLRNFRISSTTLSGVAEVRRLAANLSSTSCAQTYYILAN